MPPLVTIVTLWRWSEWKFTKWFDLLGLGRLCNELLVQLTKELKEQLTKANAFKVHTYDNLTGDI